MAHSYACRIRLHVQLANKAFYNCWICTHTTVILDISSISNHLAWCLFFPREHTIAEADCSCHQRGREPKKHKFKCNSITVFCIFFSFLSNILEFFKPMKDQKCNYFSILRMNLHYVHFHLVLVNASLLFAIIIQCFVHKISRNVGKFMWKNKNLLPSFHTARTTWRSVYKWMLFFYIKCSECKQQFRDLDTGSASPVVNTKDF